MENRWNMQTVKQNIRVIDMVIEGILEKHVRAIPFEILRWGLNGKLNKNM